MNNIFWALLILFLVAAFLRLDWVYYLVYVVGGIWVFSHIWIRRSLGRIDVQRELPARAFAGERIDARLHLVNRSWLPLAWLQIQDAVPLDLKDQPEYRTIVSLGSRARLVQRYRLYCRRRGYYAVGPLMLRTSDLFAFVEARWEETTPARLIVYPEVVPLARLGLPSRSPFGNLAGSQRLAEDPARMAGVRAYAAGDSLRRIHWKATAHADTLLVKKLQPSQAVPVTLLVDLNRESYPPRTAYGSSEWAIIVAASVANAMIDARQAVGISVYGLDSLADAPALPLPPRTGQEQLMEILSLLARVQLQSDTLPLAAWLPAQVASVTWGTTLVLVAPQVDEQTLWVLHNAYRRGSNVVVLACARNDTLRAMQARGQRLGVQVHSTLWESDLSTLAPVRAAQATSVA